MTKKTPYQIVTDTILDLLEQGTVPWHKPWAHRNARPHSLTSRKPYRGINIWLLGCLPYEQPFYVTFKRCGEWGGKVKKGEHGHPIIFWKMFEKKDADGVVTDKIPMLRWYKVWNVEQCDGLEGKYEPLVQPEYAHSPIERAEDLLRVMPKPDIQHGSPRACYAPQLDIIRMPKVERFEHREEYYSTLFHELVHSTGHESRLSRNGFDEYKPIGGASMMTKAYAQEELVAEMGASMLCGEVSILDRTVDNSAAYIKTWQRRLGDDPKLVVTAAGLAQKAADYLLGIKYDHGMGSYTEGYQPQLQEA